ncbi:MAG TPA: hypothetical protein VK779_03940 [Rhizomicrobium sp.]|jgi:hypothetical protein|nr:hypothetical protein [Rhizomicrobium sp.]
MRQQEFGLQSRNLPRMTPSILASSVLALSAAFAIPAAAASPPNSSDSAVGIDTHFESGGMGTHLGPVGKVSHDNNGAYDKTVHVGKINETAPIIDQNPTPTIFINAGNVNSEVKSSGIEIDSETSQASSSVGNASLMLNLNPLPPEANPVAPLPYLQITGKNFTSQANFNKVFPSNVTANGSASVHNLQIIGSLVGGQTLTYSGSAPPNTVLYDSPTVTVTLNRQMQVGLISCSPNCVYTPYSITVTALAIDLNKADVDGHKVTGEIVIGESAAQ